MNIKCWSGVFAALALLACESKSSETSAPSEEPSRAKPRASARPSASAVSSSRWHPPVPTGKPAHPILLFAAEKLPAAVTGLRRDVLVVSGAPPDIYLAASAAQHLCKGPALAAYSIRADAFYAPELMAADLANAPRLAAWLDCGTAALEAAKGDMHLLYVALPDLPGPVEVRIVPAKHLPFPDIFRAATTPIAGLTDTRCLTRTEGQCDDHALAVAYVEALGVTAVGDLAALRLLTAPPDAKRSEAFGRIAKDLDGPFDVAIGTDRRPYIDTLDTLDDYRDELAPTRDAFFEELRKGLTICGHALPSNYVGTARVTLEMATADSAKSTAAALQAYVTALAQAPAPPDRPMDGAFNAMLHKAVASARVAQKGNIVTLELQLTPEPGNDPITAAEKVRAPKLAAYARILEAAAGGSKPADDDLRTLGGDPLVQTIRDRRGAAASPPSAHAATLEGFPEVLVPPGSLGPPRSPLEYPTASPAIVDDMLALLVSKNHTVRLEYLTSAGPVFVATRGASYARCRITKGSSGLRIDVSGTSSSGW